MVTYPQKSTISIELSETVRPAHNYVQELSRPVPIPRWSSESGKARNIENMKFSKARHKNIAYQTRELNLA